MKRVYIAGPYSSDNIIGGLENIRRGRRMAAKLLQHGIAVFCPWLDSELFMQLREGETITLEQIQGFLTQKETEEAKREEIQHQKEKELELALSARDEVLNAVRQCEAQAEQFQQGDAPPGRVPPACRRARPKGPRTPSLPGTRQAVATVRSRVGRCARCVR